MRLSGVVRVHVAVPTKSANLAKLEVIGNQAPSSETHERVDRDRITTRIVGTWVLCGNGSAMAVIGDAWARR